MHLVDDRLALIGTLLVLPSCPLEPIQLLLKFREVSLERLIIVGQFIAVPDFAIQLVHEIDLLLPEVGELRGRPGVGVWRHIVVPLLCSGEGLVGVFSPWVVAPLFILFGQVADIAQHVQLVVFDGSEALTDFLALDAAVVDDLVHHRLQLEDTLV